MTPKQVTASELASKQKRRVVMAPDGNCFHRAWAMRLWGNEDLHQRARNLEGDFLRAHPDLFLEAIQKEYPGGKFPTSAAYADHICTPREWASDFDAGIMLAATGLARVTNHVVDERSGAILNSYVVAEGDDPAGRTIDLIALPRHYDLAVDLHDVATPAVTAAPPAALSPALSPASQLAAASVGATSAASESLPGVSVTEVRSTTEAAATKGNDNEKKEKDDEEEDDAIEEEGEEEDEEEEREGEEEDDDEEEEDEENDDDEAETGEVVNRERSLHICRYTPTVSHRCKRHRGQRR